MLLDKTMRMLEKDNKTLKVVNYIIQHADPVSKIFDAPYSQIKRDTGVSDVTISAAFRAMQKMNCAKNIGKGKWEILVIESVTKNADGPNVYLQSMA